MTYQTKQTNLFQVQLMEMLLGIDIPNSFDVLSEGEQERIIMETLQSIVDWLKEKLIEDNEFNEDIFIAVRSNTDIGIHIFMEYDLSVLDGERYIDHPPCSQRQKIQNRLL
ncbi:MAG: hypothetical protein GXP45_06815 [bacterium]|nr:hypothetical protein [bacterium]